MISSQFNPDTFDSTQKQDFSTIQEKTRQSLQELQNLKSDISQLYSISSMLSNQ